MPTPAALPIVDLVIPALDEEAALPLVLEALPEGVCRQVVVVDNGSRDRTAEVAAACGATVVREGRRGYGSACLAGIHYVGAGGRPPDILAFLDADASDDPAELPRLLEPIRAERADLVIGSRVLGDAERGALLLPQRASNLLATSLIHALYGHRYTDLGPFRAIRWQALAALGMCDTGYGWMVEMQIKALRIGLRVMEVPVHYRRRAAGDSKVSGTIRGTIGASGKILFTILRYSTAR